MNGSDDVQEVVESEANQPGEPSEDFQVTEAERQEPSSSPAPTAEPFERDSRPPKGDDEAGGDYLALEHMLDLPLEVTVELGRTTMQLGEALALQPGSIIELNRLPGEPLDMHVNERLVARGEVVVVNDVLGLRITEVIGRERR